MNDHFSLQGHPHSPLGSTKAASAEVDEKTRLTPSKATDEVPLLRSSQVVAEPSQIIVDTPQGHHYDDAYEYQRAAQARAASRGVQPGSSSHGDGAVVAAIQAVTTSVPQEDSRARTRRVLENWCTILDELYPKMTIDIIFVDEPFGPESVHHLSEELGIPKNYMFMTCPSDKFNHTVGHLGGVRVIQH